MTDRQWQSDPVLSPEGSETSTAPSERDLQQLRQLLTEPGAEEAELASGSPDCPSSESLTALVFGGDDAFSSSTGGPEREELVEHLSRCSTCSLEVKVAMEAKDFLAKREDPVTTATVTPPVIARNPRQPRWWLLAASLIAFLGAGLWWSRTTVDVTEPLGVTERSSQTSSVQPEPHQLLAESPKRFSWPSQPGATEYQLIVYSSGGREIWRSPPVQEARLTAEQTIDLDLAQGNYLWEVHVGGRVPQAVLGPFWFELGLSAKEF